MESRFKSNNFVAILIALLLFAAGFVLYFMHEQADSSGKRRPVKATTAFITEVMSPGNDSRSDIALIQVTQNRPTKTATQGA